MIRFFLNSIPTSSWSSWTPPTLTSAEEIGLGHQVALMGVNEFVHSLKMRHDEQIKVLVAEDVKASKAKQTTLSKVVVAAMLIATIYFSYTDISYRNKTLRGLVLISCIVAVFAIFLSGIYVWHRRKLKMRMENWSVLLLEKYTHSQVHSSRE